MSGPVIVLSIALFIAVLLAGLVYLYTAAMQAAREDRELYALYRKKLQEARRDYHWVRKQIQSNWPIWPRPLLFEQLDHDTQLTLGQAGYAIDVLERAFAALDAVDALNAGRGTLLNVPENIRRMRAGAANNKRLAEFEAVYPLIEEAKLIVRENQNEIVAIKQRIREAAAQLTQDFEAAGQNIQFFYALGSARYDDAITNIILTQNCLNAAEHEMHEAEQPDLVEWATADVLNRLGALSFAIFNLKGKSFTYSEAYEADLVLDKLNALTNQVQAGLDDTQFHDWAYLVATKNALDGLQAEFETAQGLLAGFDALVQKFKTLVNQLSAINIDDLIESALKAQRELEEYLGAPGASADWEKIRSPYEPPAQLLEQKKAQYSQAIEPAFQGMVIKQSELPGLIDTVGAFLLDIKKINALVNHLEIWTSENRRCEREVKQLLGSQGEVATLVQTVETFSSDSSPEIMQRSQGLRQAFQRSSARAFGPRSQAGFISLLKDVRDLGGAYETLIAQHEAAIEALQIEAAGVYRALQQMHNRLFETYQPRRPLITQVDWEQVRQAYQQAVQQYAERGNRYSAIRAATQSMRALIAGETRLLRTCEQQFSTYRMQYNHLGRQIATAQIEIAKDIEALQTNWSQPLAEFITILRAYYEQYRRLAEQLQTIPDAPNMQMASRTLEVIDQNASQLDDMRYELVDQAFELKHELDDLKKYVDGLKNKKLSENNMKAWSGANKNIADAERTTDPVKAKEYLNQATRLLEYAHLYTPPVKPTPVNVRSSKLENRGMTQVSKEVRQGSGKRPPAP